MERRRRARAGYRYRMTGENIAAGQMTPDAAVGGWIRSPGHCANLMNSGYTEFCAVRGRCQQQPGWSYWVQQFGTPL